MASPPGRSRSSAHGLATGPVACSTLSKARRSKVKFGEQRRSCRRLADDVRMRTVFHERLDALTDQLVAMCRLAGEAIGAATDSLNRVDLAVAEQVFALNEQLEAMREPCEAQAMSLLALQSPVAGDLRVVVSGIHLIGDLVRMGALAEHIAAAVRRRHPDPVASSTAGPILLRMGELAGALASTAAEVLVDRDPDRAARLDADDDEMDELLRRLFAAVTAPDWSGGVNEAVDVTLLGRYYERFGDHAVEVGRRIVFLATGIPADRYTSDPDEGAGR